MPGTELGKAYVQIVPSARGIKGAIENTLGGPLQKTGISLGNTLSTHIGSGLQKIGGAMTSFITKPALAAVAALGGATIFSGWKRMTEIDNAKVKLQAIGNSMKDVEIISQNALASVKGTAYGMDAAMTTSASAVAAGIKPGKELEAYLKAIADAAAVAGVDMSDMGSIFNKVATSGKAHNDVLNQMADAGIPIYQYLADQLGVSADKVFELAKAGDIGLADFQAAVTNHIGGAAKEIGSKTITGALSNLKAAISRIGANFLGSADDADSFAGKILPMLNNLMENMAPLEEKAKELGAKFADAFSKFADAVSKIPLPVLGGIASALVGMGPAISIVGKLIPIFAGMTGPVAAVVGGIAALAAVLGIAYAKSETFRNAVNDLVKAIGPLLLPVLKSAGDFLKILITEVVETSKAIGDALAPIIEALTPAIKVLVTLLGTRLRVSFALMGAGIQIAGALIRAAAKAVQDGVKWIQKTLSNAIPAFKKFASSVKTALTFSNIVAKVKSTFNSLKEALIKPFQPAYEKIKSIVDKIKHLFPLSVGKIFSGLKLPHFSVSGGSAPWGIGGKGSMPKFNVSWYAKGAIIDGATLIGAGEKGSEAILPLDPFWKRLDKVQSRPNVINNYFTVNGAEDPENWADRASRRLTLQMNAR